MSPEHISFSIPDVKLEHLQLLEKKLAGFLQGILRLKPSSKKPDFFSLWNSQKYISAPEQLSPEQTADNSRNFSYDVLTLLAERAIPRTVLHYPVYGHRGIDNAYSQPLIALARERVAQVEASGGDPTRAQLELNQVALFDQWLDDAEQPEGSTLMLWSPHGTVADGYFGTNRENYHCVYVYVKNATVEKAEPTAQFYQFHSWDEAVIFLDLYKRICHQGQAKSCPSVADVQPKTPLQQLLISGVTLTPDPNIVESVEQEIWRHKADWPIKPEKIFPLIDGVLVQRQLQEAMRASQLMFEQLAGEENSAESLDQAVHSLFVQLLQWTNQNARNYLGYDPALNGVLSAEQLVAEWQQQQQTKAAGKPSFELPSFTSPLDQVMSMAHCAVFSPPSLLQQLSAQPFANISLFGLNSAELLQSVQGLSIEHKSQLLDTLSQYVAITVNGERWHVPAEYLGGLGCDFDPIQNAVVGPCIDPNRPGTGRIPLRDDPMALTGAAFDALMVALQTEPTDAETTLAAATAGHGRAIQQATLTLFYTLSKTLLKPTAGIEAFLHNQYVQQLPTDVSGQLAEVHQQIQVSLGSPLQQLANYLAQLVQTHSETSFWKIARAFWHDLVKTWPHIVIGHLAVAELTPPQPVSSAG